MIVVLRESLIRDHQKQHPPSLSLRFFIWDSAYEVPEVFRLRSGESHVNDPVFLPLRAIGQSFSVDDLFIVIGDSPSNNHGL
jgi:hypothetical protein